MWVYLMRSKHELNTNAGQNTTSSPSVKHTETAQYEKINSGRDHSSSAAAPLPSLI